MADRSEDIKKKLRQPNIVEKDKINTAAKEGDLTTLQQLRSSGVDVTGDLTGDGRTALHYAAGSGRYDAAVALLNWGAKVDAVWKGYKMTPLYLAAEYNHLQVMSLLISHGADVNMKDLFGNTPLVRAVIFGSSAAVYYLIKEVGVDPTQCPQRLQEKMKILLKEGEESKQQGKHLDDRTIKAYQEALKMGKRRANKFKLVLLGAEGAGKTSTAASLLNKDFKPEQTSTVGADVNTCTVDCILVSKWKHTNIAHHLEKLPKQFRSEIKAYIKAFTPSDKKPVSSTKEPFLQQEELTHHGKKEHLLQQKMSEEDIVKVREVIDTQEVDTNDVNIVILDLGGQEIYYTIHFLFLAQEDVIFIAFNASKGLESLKEPVVTRQRLTRFQKKVKARGMQTNLKVLETAMLSVYSHCGKEVADHTLYVSNRIPTIVLVATHAKGLSLLEKEAIRLFISESFCGKPFVDHLPRSLAMGEAVFFIDNSERDPEVFDALRGVALNVAAPTMALECPISYLQFEADILRESQRKSIITKRRAADIAERAGLKEVLDEVLNHFTMKGTLLYYPEVESLRSHVFISPQEVSNLVSTVISTDNCQPSSAKLQRVCDRYDNFGLLEEALLDDLLEAAKRMEDKSIILGFLVKFHLAVEVARETKFTEEDDSYSTPTKGAVYLVPSMLVYNEAKIYKRKPEDFVILYHFPDKFIPEDGFNQVLVKMVNWSNQHHHHIQSINRGVGAFRFKDKPQCFTLQQCTDTFSIKLFITIDLNDLDKEEVPEIAVLCQQLKHHLQDCIKAVHHSLIPCAAEPIGYLECPLQHDGNPEPHLRLDKIDPAQPVRCPKNGKKIRPSTYGLLFAVSLDDCVMYGSCPMALVKIAQHYDQLVYLSITNLLPKLISKEVITLDEKRIINIKQLETEKMTYILDDVIIPSLKLNFGNKYNGFVASLKESKDIAAMKVAERLGPMVLT